MKTAGLLFCCFLFPLILCAQDVCSELEKWDNDFTARCKSFLSLQHPTTADWQTYRDAYMSYRSVLDANKDAQVVPLVGLTMASQYCFDLYKRNKYAEAMEEIKFAYDHFLENVERGEARCYAAFVGRFGFSQPQVQHVGTNFFYVGTYVATDLNDYAFAQKLLMKTDERELLGNFYECNLACTRIFRYKMQKGEIDEACFTAAYGYMMSNYQKVMTQRFDSLTPGVDANPMDVIVNPAFIKYKPARLTRYNYLDYHDYFTNLYSYLAGSNAAEKEQQQTLKMFIRVFNAERKRNGINQDFLKLLGRGVGDKPDAIDAIIQSGDKELVQLLADFINDNIKNNGYYNNMKLIYGGYLCYHHLGNKKMADKLYKRVSKTPDERFKRID